MNDSKKNTPLISVVVCTYNRAELLNICLQSLEKQNISLSKYEIIVINNNSSDNTQEVADKFIKKYPNVRCVIEKKQGLSHSRNRGYKEANGEYIAYIDDDAKAPGNWLEVADEIIKRYSPDIFGGPIYPFYLTPKPEWFDDKYEIRVHHQKSGWLTENSKRLLSGSNIIFKKKLLEELGGFNVNLGMTGNMLAYGEEAELILKSLKRKNNIYYSLKLRVEHLVPEHKLHLWYHVYSNYQRGKYLGKVWNAKYNLDTLNEIAETLDALMHSMNNIINNKGKYPHFEKIIVEKYSGVIREIGKRTGYLLNRDNNIKGKIKRELMLLDKTVTIKEIINYNIMLLKKTKLINNIKSFLKNR